MHVSQTYNVECSESTFFKITPLKKKKTHVKCLMAAVVHFCIFVPLILGVDPLLSLPPGLVGPGQNEMAGQDQEKHGHQHSHSGQEHRPPVLLDLDKDVAQVAGDGAEHQLQGPVRVHQLAFVEKVAVTCEIGTGEPYL